VSAAEARKLEGRWMRTDHQYMVWIRSVAPDGALETEYLNPRPIHVSRAEWDGKDGRLRILVELRDELYPGSYYELTYDAVNDGLYGVYHHLGVKQDFEVAFYRRAGADGQSSE
jgi:hypothetical protein